MKQAAFKTNPINHEELLRDCGSGKIQLPDFQRSWVWDEERIRSLVASISQAFPVGALMTLEMKTGAAISILKLIRPCCHDNSIRLFLAHRQPADELQQLIASQICQAVSVRMACAPSTSRCRLVRPGIEARLSARPMPYDTYTPSDVRFMFRPP